MQRKKIGIYNPYLHSLSGGERYTMTLASHWSQSHDVDIFWDDESIISQVEQRFGLDCSRVNVAPNIFKLNIVQKMMQTKKYDCIVVLTDGSIPVSCAKTNILHVQVPLQTMKWPWWKKRMYQKVICNSQFTKSYIDESLGCNSDVIYPPVDTTICSTEKKEKIILAVGRFSGFHHMKKQDIMIDAFIQAQKNGTLVGWKFILAGGLLPSDEAYVRSLRTKIAENKNIQIITNYDRETIQDLYAKATLFWHAAGFGETDPSLMEHFGITTVEAMSAGCIPVVYAAGGQKEIIVSGKNGFLWNTTEELIAYSEQAYEERDMLKDSVMKDSKKFGVDTFCTKFDSVLESILK